MKLRQRGISTLLDHHAGKAGLQRGTSRREDLLDTVLALRHPSDHYASDGLCCEVIFEKTRGFTGPQAESFEVRMEIVDGAAKWSTSVARDSLLEQAVELKRTGQSIREIARELKVSKSKVERLLQRGKAACRTEGDEACPNVPRSAQWDSETADQVRDAN